MVKVAVSPALIEPASGVFSTTMSGQLTVTVAVEVLLARFAAGSLVADTVAVFVRRPHCWGDVVADTVTSAVACGAMFPKSQVKTPLLMAQAALFSDQIGPVGSVSVKVTPCAVPGPLLVT